VKQPAYCSIKIVHCELIEATTNKKIFSNCQRFFSRSKYWNIKKISMRLINWVASAFKRIFLNKFVFLLLTECCTGLVKHQKLVYRTLVHKKKMIDCTEFNKRWSNSCFNKIFFYFTKYIFFNKKYQVKTTKNEVSSSYNLKNELKNF